MKGRPGLFILTALVLCFASQVSAQSLRNCAPRESVVQRLTEGYGETRQSVGLGRGNALVEVFASDQSGSWTITITMPNGTTCLVASGQSFEALAEVLPQDGKDA